MLADVPVPILFEPEQDVLAPRVAVLRLLGQPALVRNDFAGSRFLKKYSGRSKLICNKSKTRKEKKNTHTSKHSHSMSFRTDIQALRAIAVLLVITFHVWPARLTGGYVGVDVFFVISGYLITGHLVREVASTGRVDLPTFYARRARRLLPAASLTLVAVGAAAYLWMPRWTWATVAADMAASTVYAENWMLLRRAVDYHAQDQAPMALQERQSTLSSWTGLRPVRAGCPTITTSAPRLRPPYGQPVCRVICVRLVLCPRQPGGGVFHDAHSLARARPGRAGGRVGG